MNKLKKQISAISRLSVVFVILFSLVANGAFAGQRVEKEDNSEYVSVEHAQLLQGPPSPDELPLNMQTTQSKPCTEQLAYLKAVQIFKTDNERERFKLDREISKQILKQNLQSHTESNIIATTSIVDSNLGRQFRLVGAKPSGTS